MLRTPICFFRSRLLRSAFLSIMLGAALASQGVAADFKIIVPASPGGGWDQLGRTVQQCLQAEKLAGKITVTNAPGAGGTIGLAQMINNNKGDPNALMVSGKGMVSAIFINQSPVTLSNATPIARLTGEYMVIVVPTNSKFQHMKDLVAAYKANPASVSWAGGLAGGVDQLTAGMIANAVAGEGAKINYVAFGGGGEVLSQTLGGHVSAGLGGYNEFAPQIKAGKLRALAISSPKRLAGVEIPTLKEQGIDVEFVNWRGLMAAPGITDAQRQELIKTITQMAKSACWKSTLEKNGWEDLLMAGDEFKSYVESEQKNVLTLVNNLALVKK
jgi:putative tricarboxylic transport membrane protein